LVLLAISTQAKKEGKTEDDWHHDTDVDTFEHTDTAQIHTREDSVNPADIPLEEGEFLGSEYTTTDGIAGVETTNTDVKSGKTWDGKAYHSTTHRSLWKDSHIKVQKIRKIIHTKVPIQSVYTVVKAFSAEYGKPLSAIEFELFNAIAITEGNHFHMKYLVRQVKKDQLSNTLRRMMKIFSVPVGEGDIAAWEHEIAEKCSEDKHKTFPIETSSVEVHRQDKWLIRSEILMATCGHANNAGFQLFAWAAYKEGAYKVGQFSDANSQTVDGLVTRWLYTNMGNMVDCEKNVAEECTNEESSTLKEYSLSETAALHVSGDDKWQEHANGNPEGTFGSEASAGEPNKDLSNKPVWNSKVNKEESSSAKP
jgi:hypothetical protein